MQIIQSKFAQFLLLLAIAILVFVFYESWLLFVAVIAHGIYAQNELKWEVMLVDHEIRESLGIYPWYSVIEDNLLLGAIPMKEKHHFEELQKIGVSVILSVVEPFEFYIHTVVGDPITPEDWKLAKMPLKQHVISTIDNLPVAFNLLDEGAEIIHQALAQQKRIYVHCKSGKGRSLSMLLAYYYRYQQMDIMTAYQKIKAARPVVVHPSSCHISNLLSYARERMMQSDDLQL